MIVLLRGTNSSGKTTVIRKIMEQFTVTPLYGMLGPRSPEAQLLSRLNKKINPIYVLGPYDGTPTSGMDRVTKMGMDAVVALVDKYQAKGHVIFEGILVSNCYGKIGAYLTTKKDNLIVAALDTPLEVCREMLHARQAASGRASGEKHQAAHHHRVAQTGATYLKNGCRCETVSRENAAEKILSWLK